MSKSITHHAVFSKEFVSKPNEGLEARKASRQGWERWKELGDRHCHIVMWCVTGVTSNLVSFPHLHASVWRKSLVNAEEGFASIQQLIPKSTLANPIAVRQEFPLVEGNFHFFLLRFDWRQWLTLQNHQDSPLAPLVITFQESVWDGAVGLWKPVGEAGYGRMESNMSSKCVQKRISVGSVIIWYHLYILAIGRWISDWATPFFLCCTGCKILQAGVCSVGMNWWWYHCLFNGMTLPPC